jgi:hypothetical protein
MRLISWTLQSGSKQEGGMIQKDGAKRKNGGRRGLRRLEEKLKTEGKE